MPVIKDTAKRERNARLFFGCSEAEAIQLNGGRELCRTNKTPAAAYLYQRQAAKDRGIAWLITFPEWVGVWLTSGKFEQRGRGKAGFCMARHGDAGPYSVENVSIQSCVQNSRDGIEKARHTMLQQPSRLGTGRGWTFARGRYQVVVGRKYVGRFHTQAEAEVAYKNAVAAVHQVPPMNESYFFARQLSFPTATNF